MLAYVFGLVLSIAHLLSDALSRKFSKHRGWLVSFVAGMSLAYLFLELFPLLLEFGDGKIAFLFVLAGFFLFFVFEVYIYQHAGVKMVAREITRLHAFGFFVYYFVLGMLIVYFLQQSVERAFLLLIPAGLYALVGKVSFFHVHADLKESFWMKAMLVLSPVLGVLLGGWVFLPRAAWYGLLGFLIGGLSYLVIRDSLPGEKEGNLQAFSLGVVLYTFLIIMLWVL